MKTIGLKEVFFSNLYCVLYTKKEPYFAIDKCTFYLLESAENVTITSINYYRIFTSLLVFIEYKVVKSFVTRTRQLPTI